ncbi:MAG TPA: tripartite tricarboxylate transporter TctB family protein [Methylomirabilota bacterium]|nr:tripartite tricarboxylate transporter TctB family protein [Methylomirabilota bacterium]
MRGMLAISGLLFALAIAYWLGADAIPKSRLGGAVGADGLPKLLAVVLGLLSVGLALQTLLEHRKRRRLGAAFLQATETDVADWSGHARAFGVIAIGIGFVVALPILGYALSVALLLMVVATYSGKRFSRGTILFGVAGGVFFYLLFVHLLKVPLPAGLLGALFSGGA